MGWKKISGHNYYYRSIRQGKTVYRRCVGGGVLGILAAICDAEAREERDERERAQREADRVAMEPLEARDSMMQAYFKAVDQVVNETLEGAGYVQHDRGAWRKSRGRSQG